jgi:hypothetical protein
LLESDQQTEANLADAVAKKHSAAHTHPESEVTSLVGDLAGKSPVGHNHDGAYLPVASFSGLAKITVAPTAPGSPGVGDLWIDNS